MTNYAVLALDPGGTTGWALYTAQRIYADEATPEFYQEYFLQGQLGPGPHHAQLYALLEQERVQEYHVVCESFEFRGGAAKLRDNINLDSKEYIGVLNCWAQRELEGKQSETTVRYQTAAMGKGLISDDKIKKAELWHPGWKHAMDATRHLLYYLTVVANRDDLARRWWKPASN